MKVRLSRIAAYKIEHLLDYLELEWSKSVRQEFLSALKTSLERARLQPLVFPSSNLNSNLRKLIVTKQTTLLYTVQGDTLFVVTLFDSRQDPEAIEKEIQKYFGN